MAGPPPGEGRGDAQRPTLSRFPGNARKPAAQQQQYIAAYRPVLLYIALCRAVSRCIAPYQTHDMPEPSRQSKMHGREGREGRGEVAARSRCDLPTLDPYISRFGGTEFRLFSAHKSCAV